MQQNRDPQKRTIGVFAPHFQGAFIGEIANQIRQYCLLRDYQYVGFSTGGFSTYSSTFNIGKLDAAIIIRNAISNELAKELCERGIATCSIAYDYFPLNIPVVSSDNAKGAEIAFHHLYEKGHKNIAFVGDLRHYDLRKRYEKFCELLEENNLPVLDNLFFSAPNTDISGGLAAGKEFIERGCEAKAIFCAAGFTTIGLLRRLRDYDKSLIDKLDIVSYDAMPITGALCPNVSAIDQNVHLIAYKAVSICCQILEQEEIERVLCVEPKLIRSENVTSENNPYLATSVDLPEIHNPAYISSIINNNYIWSEEIFTSKLNDLMIISPLFEKFMKLASFTRLSTGKSGKEAAKIMKIFTLSTIDKVENITPDAICLADNFPPPKLQEYGLDNYDNETHFFIENKKEIWGVISTYGNSNCEYELGSYLFMCGQLTSVSKMMSLLIEGSRQEKAQPITDTFVKENVKDLNYLVTWDIENNSTQWTSEALNSLGFTTTMDINIYQNMDISDRVHTDQLAKFREELAHYAINGGGFQTFIKLREKSGKYLDFKIRAETENSEDGKISSMKIFLSPSETEE